MATSDPHQSKQRPLPSARRVALRTAVLYGAAGILWIAGTDLLLNLFAPDPGTHRQLQWFKGCLFIVVTAGFLYAMIRQYLCRWQEQRTLQEAAVAGQLRTEEHLAKFASVTPDVMFTFRMDADGHFTFPFTNPRMEDFYPGSAEALKQDGTPAFDNIHEDDRARVMAAITSTAATLEPFREEFRIIHPLRGEIWVDAHSMPERESDGSTMWYGFFRDTTLRHRAERNLHEATRLLRAVMDQTTDAVFVKDRDGRYLLFNEAAAGYVGMPVSEVLGKTDEALFDAESAELLRDRDRRILESGKPETAEETITAAGLTRTFMAMKAPYRLADGRIAGTIGISRDITDWKLANASLAVSEERLRLAAKAADLGTWDWDIVANTIHWSDEVWRFFGFLPNSLPLTFEVFRNAIHPEDRDRVLQHVEAVIRGEGDYSTEFRIVQPGGQIVWVSASGEVIRDSAGKPVRMLGIHLDITQRKRSEAALRISEERLKHALDATLDGIWDWDIPGGTVYFSPQWERLLGYEPGQVPQRVDFFYTLVHPDDVAHLQQVLDDHLAGKTAIKENEVRLRTTSGEYRWFLDCGKVVERDESGQPKRMVGTITDITARKKSEADLQASEELYRTLVTTVAEGIILQRKDGSVLAWNPAALSILGLTDEQLTGRTSFDPEWRAVREDGSPLPGEEHPPMVAIRTGKPQIAVTMGIHRPDGTLVWLTANARPIFRAGSTEPESVVCSFADITARKRVEMLAVGHKHVLEMIASGVPLQQTLDSLLRLIESQSDEMRCSILLMDPDGAHLRCLAGPRIPPPFSAAIDGLAIGENVGSCGTAAYRKEPVMVEDIATDPLWKAYRDLALSHGLAACWSIPIFDRDRAVVATFAVYYTRPAMPSAEDGRLMELATHAAAIAINRHRNEAALRESERRYRQLIAGLPLAVYTTDADGYISLFNEACARLWGRRPQVGVDRWTAAKSIFTPEGQAVSPSEFPIVTAMREKRAIQAADQVIERDDGLRVHCLAYPNPLFDEDNKLIGAMNVLVDVTPLKAAEAELQKAYDDLRQTQEIVLQQERLRAFGQMASGVAHDINNAICPVSIYSGILLKTEPDLSERAREFLEIIHRAAEGVGQTVSRLREFYRHREQSGGFVGVDLGRLIDEVVALTRARWKDMPMQQGVVIDLRTELEPGLPLIAGAETELREALINLIFNAVDAMPAGGSLIVRTRTLRPQEGERDRPAPEAARVCLEVVDTGMGMDAEARRRCLEPFYTTKGERGTGLGLAIVCGIAQRHEADITIDSTPGVGTTVRLTFPVPSELSSATTQSNPSPATQRLNILAVDDDPLILTAIRLALETEGHTVESASGGQEAIDTFQSALKSGAPFDVIFTDLGMPRVDGRTVASAVKAASPETSVILLTGWGHGMQENSDLPPGVDRVIGKPASPRDLHEALAGIRPHSAA